MQEMNIAVVRSISQKNEMVITFIFHSSAECRHQAQYHSALERIYTPTSMHGKYFLIRGRHQHRRKYHECLLFTFLRIQQSRVSKCYSSMTVWCEENSTNYF